MLGKDLRIPTTPRDLIRAVLRGGGVDKTKPEPKPEPKRSEGPAS